jgi:hypothetical protein
MKVRDMVQEIVTVLAVINTAVCGSIPSAERTLARVLGKAPPRRVAASQQSLKKVVGR